MAYSHPVYSTSPNPFLRHYFEMVFAMLGVMLARRAEYAFSRVTA